jgi:hypothetical protein
VTSPVGFASREAEFELPANTQHLCRELPVKFRRGLPGFAAKMAAPKKRRLKPKKTLDLISAKPKRGRPTAIRPSEVRNRGDNYRLIFGQIWNNVGQPLLRAQTEKEVVQTLEKDSRYVSEFRGVAALILSVLHERKFPKRRAAQIGFLADSLAARGITSARRSRDICERERNKKEHYIKRRDFYIECSCGYEGPALYGKCFKWVLTKSILRWFFLIKPVLLLEPLSMRDVTCVTYVTLHQASLALSFLGWTKAICFAYCQDGVIIR